MAAGLLAGAIGGLGRAMQHNAQSTIEQRRQEALRRLDHDMAIEREGVRHQNNLETEGVRHEYGLEREGVRHEYGLERDESRHGQQFEMERYRQGQQNRRTFAGISARQAEGRNDWQLVPMQGGGYGRYNPRTNQFEEANLPPGAMPDGGGLSDRAQATLDYNASRIESIDKQLEMATGEDRQALLDEQRQLDLESRRILNNVGAGDLDAAVDDALGGDAPPPGIRHPSLGGPPAPGENDGAAPPPRPGAPSSYRDLESQALERRRAQGLIRSTQEEARQIESEITRIRGLAAQTSIGPLTTPQEREQLANEVRQRTDSLMQQHDLTDAQRSRLENAVETILQRVG